MNAYTFDVSFSTGVISSPYFTLVVNDHNSTTFKFKFDQDGRYVFKMLYPDGTCYVQDIVNNELILGKGVLNQDGNYRFEISLYGDDNRLTTSLTKEFPVRLELVDTDVPVEVDDRVPILDNLIEQTNTILQEAKDGKFDGATFTPSVNENGDLSWTNDKGKENPQTVNIMGPQGEPGAIKLQVVETLPEIGESDTIYLVKKSTPTEQNIYDEYVYTNKEWEHIGDTSVDLSNYYTKDETNDKLDKKQNILTPGENITIDENNVISSGKTNYLGYIEDYTSNNRLDITNLEKGTYSLGIKAKIGSQILYLKVLHNEQEQTLNTTLTVNGTVVSNMIYFEVTNPIKYINGYDEAIRISFLDLTGNMGEIVNKKYAINYNSTNGILSNGSYYNTTISAVTTNTEQTISSKKTFTTLPESSSVPTNDNQFTNKKYVDDNKYSLPKASADTLGGIKIGDNLNIDENGVVSASGGEIDGLPRFFIECDISEGTSPIWYSKNSDMETKLTNAINEAYNSGALDFVLVFGSSVNKELTYLENRITINNDKKTLTTRTLRKIVGLSGSTYRMQNMALDYGTWNYNDGIWSHSNSSNNIAGQFVSDAPYISSYNVYQNFLSKTNTTSYTPTSDYNPSTKKYVDDSSYNVTKNVNNALLILPQNLVDSGFDYNTHEIIYIPVNYTIENISTNYIFELNENEYYESNNKGVNSSYSLCKVTFNNEQPLSIPISYISSGENNYDYGIFSNIDKELSENNSDDGATGSEKVFKNCKGESSTDVKEIVYEIPSGEHFIYIKYRKDSGGNSGNDSLQFKIPSVISQEVYENKKIATTEYVDDSISTAITDALGGSY